MALSVSALQRHQQHLHEIGNQGQGQGQGAGTTSESSPDHRMMANNPNIAKSGLVPVIKMEKSDYGEKPVSREWDPIPATGGGGGGRGGHAEDITPNDYDAQSKPKPQTLQEQEQEQDQKQEQGYDVSEINFEANGVFWAMGTTEDGDNYYYEIESGLSQWEDPREYGNLIYAHTDQEHQEQEKQSASTGLTINTAGAGDVAGDMAAEDNEDDGYDLGLHTINLGSTAAARAASVEANDDVLNISVTAVKDK